MRQVVVDEKFDFVLDYEMYELAREALGLYAPEQVKGFTAERFFARKRWLLVPDTEFNGLRWFKAESKLVHGPPYLQTIKLNLWRFPDLRKSGAPMPHNHPWPFFSKLLKGGYRESRGVVKLNRDQILADPYSKWDVGGIDLTQGVTHVAGEVNRMPLTTFHEVTEILQRDTLSLMNCSLGRPEGWGHLEDDGKGNLVYVPNKLGALDPRHESMKLALNPHLRRR